MTRPMRELSFRGVSLRYRAAGGSAGGMSVHGGVRKVGGSAGGSDSTNAKGAGGANAHTSCGGDSTKGTGEDGSLLAICDLDFTIHAGQAITVIGPSGCGKSTMLQLACGLLQPSVGEVLADGSPLAGPQQGTALIPQDFGLLPWKSVQENAELGLKVRGVPRAERRRRANEALALVGLEGFGRCRPRELSGGMQQRLALARALALDVRLMLMDEPLSAIDALLREQLQDTLLQLWRDHGYAQVLVTHSIEEAVFLGQRVAVMSPRPGRIAAVMENPLMGEPSYRGTAAFHERCGELRALLREVGTHA